MLRKTTLLLVFALLSTAMLFGQAKNPVATATEFMRTNLKDLQLTESDIADMIVNNQVVSKHNKVTHLYFKQRHQGIEVHNAIFNVNLLENGEVLNYGNRFVAQLDKRVNTTTPQLTMEQAVASFMQQFNISGETPQMVEQKDAVSATFDHRGIALEPIKVKLTYQPTADKRVRLAWNVTFYETNAQHWWNARVDAQTGEVIDFFDQVTHCEFSMPAELCEDDHAHDHAEPYTPVPFVETTTTTTSGDEPTYRVYPLFTESPNHGDRTLEVNPADVVASPFGWHDTDGEEGAEFTITRGNNVHAYNDIYGFNRSLGDEPDGGDTLCFDFPIDLATNIPYTQLDPLVTNLFYWNNMVHDVWAYYGFDEAAGNFQETNYSGEGVGGDYVQAEALDGSGTNNANFATPPDGSRPRMQMFLWDGQLPDLESSASFDIIEPNILAGSYPFEQAAFGALFPFDTLFGEVVVVDDGEGITTDACDPIQNGTELNGNIALIDRGNCQFGVKALAAEQQGAIAVIICNNDPSAPIQMAPGTAGDQVTIPALMIAQDFCQEIRDLEGLEIALAGNYPIPTPGPTGRSSDLDNGVIVHEYGHGISIRLTGGAASSCLSGTEQAGEGWSDWFALAMTTTSADNADEPRGIGTYASGEPTTGDGIRTYPYTRDMNVNPHTYADINDFISPNGVSVHGVGSIFCATIWDMYWNLVDVYGFDDNLYTGTGGNNIAIQLVTDGLKLQPCSPTFLDSRDAILAADMANYDGANQCLIWETFARRGIGASAQPGGVEAFDLPFDCREQFKVRKEGIAEAQSGDTITYTLEIANGRLENLTEDGLVIDQLPVGATYLEGSSDCPITELDGELTFNAGMLNSNESIFCTYQVVLDSDLGTEIVFEDDLESGTQNWAIENSIGDLAWVLVDTFSNSGSSAFFVPNPETQSEQFLIFAEPRLLNSPNPAFTFWHFYNTEANWDGGVVEISIDGVDWIDLGDNMVQNGYNGSLNTNENNTIGGRPAFNGNSGEWVETIIDLSDYTGEAVLIRFRFGADALIGAEGWFIDDMQFWENLHTVTNVACATDDGETICSEVTTFVFSDRVTSTTTLNQTEQLSIFPNPSEGQFTIQLESPVRTEVELRVMGIDGRLLLQREYDAFMTESINLSGYGSGVYLVQLRTERGITTRRIVVE